ncbi:DUF3558 domain-containing protein [Nocardia cyriacigeorgica]|uniref:DUF3558 domain-containing protein n=1 Tax=Nocardia cyriacigeorgica TaxID=135487 RepID=UPI0024568C7B|nr:DUF3558 domain-containing protein [Nocardia cyriacigeorgica]
MNRKFGVGLAAFMLALSGCGSDSDNALESRTPTPTTAPQLSVSVQPAPVQHNIGRDKVEFDPCVGVGDDKIVAAGFEPGSRERSDYIFDDYSFIGCSFEFKESVHGQKVTTRTLTVWSGNITLEEYRDRYGTNSTELTIDGRAAMHYSNPELHDESCSVAIQSSDGVLDVTKSTRSVFTTEKPCDRIEEISAIISDATPD